MKEFPIDQKGSYFNYFFRFVVDGSELKKVGTNGSEYVYASKDKPKVTLLYWNPDARAIIDYLVRNKIGIYTTTTEPNWDEDPCGRRVQRGTRTWYYFDFSNLFN